MTARLRTGHSFRVAVGKQEEIMDRLVELGYKIAPITDRASCFGWARWAKLAKKKGLRPVFGIELAVTESLNAKKPTVDYWTFIAKDSLLPLHELFELATTQFRYEPLLTYPQALEAKGVFKVIGSRSFLENFSPAEDMYVALSPSASIGYLNKARRLGFKFIASSDNKYPLAGDQSFYEVVCGRGASIQSYPQHILSEDEWCAAVNADKEEMLEAQENLIKVLEGSTAELGKGSLFKPEHPASLLALCEDGAKRLGCDLKDPVYKARLDRELKLIKEKDFEDYFYIITDLVRWARANMLVGPARGSSCGSLVCYLLEITTVDPIPYGLIFERFIDVNRNDLPDIDIDFSDRQRHLVFEYMAEKYGAAHVARLGTVSKYGAPAALKEAGAALQVPKWKCDAVAESLLKRSSGDARALDSLLDTLNTMPAGIELLKDFPEMLLATRMEGHPRHYSQHAAGIILTAEPVNHYVAIDRRTGATQCDKKDAEELNLLKIDALGLTQLSVFEYALELAGLDRLHLETIPKDDPAAFEVINKKKYSGIFQFNGIALQSLAKQFTLDSLNDIVAVTALARPGPLASGGANEWVKRRNGAAVTYPHPIFEPYLRDTLGIVLYQEQVMEIGRNVGDLSWEDVSSLRKAMSKSMGAEFFDSFGNPWKAKAIEKGVDPKVAKKVWDELCSYGSWSFNKSHAVAYGLISYWCCWLKAHYPFEFAAATLSYEADPDKQLILLREMVEEGYSYLPVDLNRSTDRWTVGYRGEEKVLIGPFTNIKGLGPKTLSAILSARARGEALPSKALKLLAKPITTIDSLFPIADAVKRLLPDPAARNIRSKPTPVKLIEQDLEDQTFLLFVIFTKINPRDENETVKVAQRGGKIITGEPTASLNLYMADDSDTIFGKVSRFDYAEIGKEIVDRGQPGKLLYAVKCTMRGHYGREASTFRMVMVKGIRFIGEIAMPKSPSPEKPDDTQDPQP